MKNTLNFKSVSAAALLVGAIALGGCNKEQVGITRGGANISGKGEVLKNVTLDATQIRNAKETYHKMPKLRYWDQTNQRFIERKAGSRDLEFNDPDEGFSFSDPDNNGVMLFSDNSGDYIVFSTGIGLAGQGGGGMVVAGNSALNIEMAVCFTAQMIADGDGFGSMFDTGFGFDSFAAVFGIGGDFEGLANANTSDPDFDPFDYLHGYAAYYVLADNVDGSHEVFDWLNYDENANYDDFASSFVMDFTNLSLYFSTGGTVEVSGGQMNFNGEYLAITDLFESFLDEGLGEEEVEASIVFGYGSMGCN